jgi:hypothetical protein
MSTTKRCVDRLSRHGTLFVKLDAQGPGGDSRAFFVVGRKEVSEAASDRQFGEDFCSKGTDLHGPPSLSP